MPPRYQPLVPMQPGGSAGVCGPGVSKLPDKLVGYWCAWLRRISVKAIDPVQDARSISRAVSIGQRGDIDVVPGLVASDNQERLDPQSLAPGGHAHGTATG